MTGEQRIVVFSGMVQGVGFRYTACRVAGGFDVAGTVRNLPDGNVECVVEGDAAEIDAFLEAIAQRMSQYIRKQTQQTAPYTGEYAAFTVAY